MRKQIIVIGLSVLLLTSCATLSSVQPLLREIATASLRWTLECALEHEINGSDFSTCVSARGRTWIEARLGAVLEELFGGVGGGGMGGELAREAVSWVNDCVLAGDLSTGCIKAKGHAWALENAPDLIDEIVALLDKLLGAPPPADTTLRVDPTVNELAARIPGWASDCNADRACVVARAERWIGGRPDAARLKAAVRMVLE